MNNLRGFKQKLSQVNRLRADKDYDTALQEVESLMETWPGSPQLCVLWANLAQLQENPTHELSEAKQALQQAIDLDKGSPAASIELGYFLDNVEDDPQAAAKSFAEGVAAARKLLLEGLIGQAKALQQLGKKEEFLNCLAELIHFARFESGAKKNKSSTDPIHFVQTKDLHTSQIHELLNELIASRSA